MANDIRVKLLLDGKEFEATLNRAKTKTSDFASQGSGISKLSSAFGAVRLGVLGAAAAIAAAALAFGALVKKGMDAEEATSKFNTIFGNNAAAMREWADQTADAMGRSSRNLQSMAADVMALVSPMAATREAALQMSQGAVQAAEDLASFHNVNVTEALTAIRSGLTGEAEPLKRFGILLTETALQEYALAQNIRTRVSDMSTAEKLQLRYNATLSQMGVASGDAARTSGSLTNVLKSIEAIIDDGATAAGTRLVPAMTELAIAFRDILKEGGFAHTVINKLVDALGLLAQGAAAVLRQFSESGREQQAYMDRVASLTSKLEDLQERYGSFGDAVDTATRGFNPARDAVEAYRFQLNVLAQELGANNPLLAAHADQLRYYGLMTEQTTAATQGNTQATNANNDAAKRWSDTRKRLIEQLQNTWASFYKYTGDSLQESLAQELSAYEEQNRKLRQLLQYRVIDRATYNARVSELEEQHSQNMIDIYSREKGIEDVLNRANLDNRNDYQRAFAANVVQSQEEIQNQLQVLQQAGLANEYDAHLAKIQIAQSDNMALRDLEMQRAQQNEQTLRHMFGMNTRFYSGLGMMANMGAQLMGNQNKKLHRLGQISSVANVLMSTAEAIMKGYAMLGPIGGTAFAALAGTVASAQIKIIKDTKPPEPIKPESVSKPSFAQGVFDIPYDMSGVDVHQGESIMPKSWAQSVKDGEINMGSQPINIIVQGSIIDKDGFTAGVSEAMQQIEGRTGLRLTSRSVY